MEEVLYLHNGIVFSFLEKKKPLDFTGMLWEANTYPPIGAWPQGLFTLIRKHVWPLPSPLCLPLGPILVVWFALYQIFVHRSSRTSPPCKSTPQ